jgi:DNA-3-methyladenine glycosylase
MPRDETIASTRMDEAPLDAAFFLRTPEAVARDLIGAKLLYDGVGGVIVETEAYHPDDPASHSFRGPTLRNAAMFSAPGTAYVYRIYGMHWCLNFVCTPGSAVLIRAFEPTAGLFRMTERRGGLAPRLLASGPGRLCSALGVTREDDGRSVFEAPFRLIGNSEIRDVLVGPRIGITKAVEEPLRFGLEGSRYLSRKF